MLIMKAVRGKLKMIIWRMIHFTSFYWMLLRTQKMHLRNMAAFMCFMRIQKDLISAEHLKTLVFIYLDRVSGIKNRLYFVAHLISGNTNRYYLVGKRRVGTAGIQIESNRLFGSLINLNEMPTIQR